MYDADLMIVYVASSVTSRVMHFNVVLSRNRDQQTCILIFNTRLLTYLYNNLLTIYLLIYLLPAYLLTYLLTSYLLIYYCCYNYRC